MKPLFVTETNWYACTTNTQWHDWQHAHSVMVGIFNMGGNNLETLMVLYSFQLIRVMVSLKDNIYSVLHEASG
jgi:hypothetical protein